MQIRCGKILNYIVRPIANFPRSMPVKELLKRSMFGKDIGKRFVTRSYGSRCIMRRGHCCVLA